MQEMVQGEEYEEEFDEDGNQIQDDESNENTDSGFDTIFGIPKKVFCVGAAIVVIVFLGIILLIAQKWKDKPEDSEVAIGPTADGAGAMDTVNLYDATGNLIGSCDGIIDDYMVLDQYGNVLGYIDSAGSTPLYDESGEQIGTYTPDDGAPIVEDFEAEESEGIQLGDAPTDMEYDEDNIKLRKAGYTGDEIELARSLGIDTNTLVEEAEKEQLKALNKRLGKVSNKKSKEFLKLYNNSIFCMEKLEFDAFDVNSDSARNYESSYVVNADYVKLPTYGHQLFIKCKVADNTYVFYNVTPDRWESLPEEGNIVLQVNYYMYGTSNVNMYVTSIEEIDTTRITVNALDNAISLEEILEENDGSGASGGVSIEEGGTDTEDGINEPW